jgi:basic amino acid/polyamine antiporter, APA family
VNLFRKKMPAPDEVHGLSRVLNAWDLTGLGIGQMIGAGIFVLTGVAAATQAGPALVVSFLIAGIPCLFVALAFAELAGSVGGCGGVYGYSYAAFGELPAWIMGWIAAFAAGISVPTVANGWSGYANNALAAAGLGLPDMLTKGPAAGGIINLPASLIILFLMMALLAGVNQSAKLNMAIVAVKVLALAVFIGVAFFHIDTGLWQPFMPFGWFETAQDGRTVGVLAAAPVVFFAYSGFQSVSFAVEEAKNPQRDVPIGTLAALAFCAALYITVSGLLTTIAPYASLNVSSPVAHALLMLGYNWGSALVAVGVIVGLTSTMLVTYYSLTRILYAMARDGLMPGLFCRIDQKTRTPALATILCGVTMSLAAGLMPLAALAPLASASLLSEFAAVCAGVFVLRLTNPSMPRPFRSPGGVTFPLLGIASCLGLMSFLPLAALERLGLALLAGIAIYFLYAGRRSGALTAA